ncbi:L-threonine ammonia-lyase [Anseongella ginsenosidimutans]|uniref:L-threonine dehydratase n=1 Tax=Anseongella ginsenosidimutans TaxID=496056 RepID=A0A4R3KRW7_9SPHI|nr:threonine ammonia-lyase IlvA [Anseongella ginsenosidimutans]QEC53159.1 threonine ammonia-lyase IlvA [Anseongella ginsenosidimutans]TCS87784.1 L-threonine ammonia-lyase [Anseongella ginsenosidimutans]
MDTNAYSELPSRIMECGRQISKVVKHTPLHQVPRLSQKYGADIWFKREDQQLVRSYKIRGAYNTIINLPPGAAKRGVVCASAGNHAQGVAYSCQLMKIRGHVFMPEVTPRQKLEKVRSFGGEWIKVELTGTTYDEAYEQAIAFCEAEKLTFVHPFDNIHTITGQGTVGTEIFADQPDTDVLIVPVGGGGLLSGLSLVAKYFNPSCRVIGVDPAGAPKMVEAFREGGPVRLETIDPFVDGAAVRQVGSLPFNICSLFTDKVIATREGKVCSTMIELYQHEGIIAEPAGVLSIAALDQLKDEIRGRKVVCILSGGNNDLARYPEVIERSLIYEGLKHYFIIEFAQKPGELRTFLNSVLGPEDDIVRFEYLKKTNKEFGPALVGIELSRPQDLEPLLGRFKEQQFRFRNVTNDDMLRKYFI